MAPFSLRAISPVKVYTQQAERDHPHDDENLYQRFMEEDDQADLGQSQEEERIKETSPVSGEMVVEEN